MDIMHEDRSYDVCAVEDRWQAEWERLGCHRSPQSPTGDKYFVHDSPPFPSGPLHLGHVRTYVLGDVTARYQRLRGKCVLYHSGFDSFGLPIELAAREQNTTPRELVTRTITHQTHELYRLGISYDPERQADTSDPEVYRWTQWLFLEMLADGLIERRDAPVTWCPKCETTLARMQVDDECCWRCETPVEIRQLPQWFVTVARYAPRLRRTLDALRWSDHAKRAIAALLDDVTDEPGTRGQGGGDWLVSRQRSWGTPIPLVHCERCGVIPVPLEELPVVLPDDLDWASGSGALARCEAFVCTTCPTCGAGARRETDTLDCAFDDQWCFFQTLVLNADTPGFTRDNLLPWLPVDRSQSGRDQYAWFHLYRFFGVFLAERGLIDEADYIHGFFGHDMILAGGRKMSKHLGNSVSAAAILESHGADALRVAMMWAAGPQRAVQWEERRLDRAALLLSRFYTLCHRVATVTPAASGATPGGSRKIQTLVRQTKQTIERVGGFIEDYRPNAGVEALATLLPRVEAFAVPRIESGRLDVANLERLEGVLDDCTVALAPFAPHLAEEVWQLRGERKLVAQSRWPG
jgi:leucyl-tRNA synthetase